MPTGPPGPATTGFCASWVSNSPAVGAHTGVCPWELFSKINLLLSPLSHFPRSLPSSAPGREPKLNPTAEAFRNGPSLTRPSGGPQVRPWQPRSPSQSNVLQGEAGSHTARFSGRGRRGSFYRHRRGSGERPSAGGGRGERGVFSLRSRGKRARSLRSSPRPRWAVASRTSPESQEAAIHRLWPSHLILLP